MKLLWNLLLMLLLALPLSGCPAADDDDSTDDDDAGDDDAGDDDAGDDDAGDDDAGDDDAGDDDAGDDDAGDDDAGDDDAGDDDAGDDDAGDDDSSVASTVSFSADVFPIVQASCGCHQGGAGGWSHGGSAAGLYGAWVGQQSGQAPALQRVSPGDTATSYVWHKINDTHTTVGGSGASMPRMQPLLPATDRNTIGTWITEGANDN